MVGNLKRFLSLLLAVVVFCTGFVSADAAFDGEKWEDVPVYVLLEANNESNSDLCFAAVKVRYSKEVNRVHLLYMLEFESFNDSALCGVIMDFNDMGSVTVMADGTTGFEQDIYYAELNNILADKNSKNIILEVTVGIKSGIPNDLILDTYIFDTNGIKSNEYSNDISDEDGETFEEVTERTTKPKTTKVKKSKVKTTKFKTVKVKTTKAKTAKNKTSKTSKIQDDDIRIFDDEQNEYSVNIESEDIDNDNERKNLTLIFGAAAALFAIAAGCSAAIKSKNKRKDRGHDDE